jgi:phospholipid-binding lipoprotein MlaA
MRVVALFCAVLALSACAARRPPGPAAAMEEERDPFENLNRKMFRFNDEVDVWVLAPTATGWKKIAPERVRTSVSNFFGNLRFPIVTINDLLQGKVKASAVDVGRFGVNTTVGVLGFFDPASRWGLEKHDEDFGQTLAVWGVPPGPYLVLPFLGPSNPRDATGLGVDTAFSVTPFFVEWYILAGARVFDIVNERSFVLTEVENAKAASFDYYAFVRNAYVQRRRALILDSAEPAPEENEDLYHPQLEDK